MSMRSLFLGLTTSCLLAATGTGLASEFSGEKAMEDLIAFCDIGPRYPGAPGHTVARDWIVERLEDLGDVTFLQNFQHPVEEKHPMYDRDKPYLELSNILCRFNPFESRRILLSAHWESRPFSDRETDPDKAAVPLVGANDAASGVVVLLELARLLKEQPVAVGVDIVLYDGEDWGEEGDSHQYLIGSRYFAQNIPDPRPSLGMNLDMIGDRDLRIPVEVNSLIANRPLVGQVWGTAKALGYEHIFVDEIGQQILDDHVPLIEVGIPVINIIDFDYPAWHTNRDTPDQCSAESLGIVGEVVWEVLKGLN